MDIEAQQATLRTFADERDWQPFHTPKNLSTALIVEAAELAEIVGADRELSRSKFGRRQHTSPSERRHTRGRRSAEAAVVRVVQPLNMVGIEHQERARCKAHAARV